MGCRSRREKGDPDRDIAAAHLIGRPKAAQWWRIADERGWLDPAQPLPDDETIAAARESSRKASTIISKLWGAWVEQGVSDQRSTRRTQAPTRLDRQPRLEVACRLRAAVRHPAAAAGLRPLAVVHPVLPNDRKLQEAEIRGTQRRSASQRSDPRLDTVRIAITRTKRPLAANPPCGAPVELRQGTQMARTWASPLVAAPESQFPSNGHGLH